MATETIPVTMSGEEMVALSKKHTLFEWSAQSKVDPIPVARAKGIYFWTPEGKRFIDFNSQLMSVNIGHGDERVIAAMRAQAGQLIFAGPPMATEPRARLGAKLAGLTPGDIDVFLFTNAGSEANENAFKIARFATGRQKILARYRSYHGATGGVITATGDPRRWSQGAYPGVIHVLDPDHGLQQGWDTAEQSLRYVEEVIQLEGPSTIAAFIVESVTGTNGILIPLDGYMQGVRALCDKYGILMIADEVMSGFGRTGEWFAINHWNVVPDLITMAKGVTGWYMPVGGVGVRRGLGDKFTDVMFPSGLTYNSHPLACATALAVIDVMEQDRLVEQARDRGRLLAALQQEMAARHPSVGAVRSIGLFGVIELVRNRDTMEPLAPFNGTSPEMAALAKFFRQEGLFTFVRWNYFFTNPPLTITEDELREAFAIIDKGLALTDAAVTSSR